MRKQIIILASLFFVGILLVGAGCEKTQPKTQSSTTGGVGLTNPSAVCCEQKGGYYTINTDSNENQNGFCDLNGTKTEAWEFYNKNCAGDVKGENTDKDTITIKDLLENPIYNQEVTIKGKVSELGNLMCPCFELTFNRQKVQVWYDLMVNEKGVKRDPVNIQRIKNNDEVMVIGELREQAGQSPLKDFWASKIEKVK